MRVRRRRVEYLSFGIHQRDQVLGVFCDQPISLFALAQGLFCPFLLRDVVGDATYDRLFQALASQGVAVLKYPFLPCATSGPHEPLCPPSTQHEFEIGSKGVAKVGAEEIANLPSYHLIGTLETSEFNSGSVHTENPAFFIVSAELYPAVLDQVSITVFALAQRLLGMFRISDISHDASHPVYRAALLTNGKGAGSDPTNRAVRPQNPKFGVLLPHPAHLHRQG